MSPKGGPEDETALHRDRPQGYPVRARGSA